MTMTQFYFFGTVSLVRGDLKSYFYTCDRDGGPILQHMSHCIDY